VPHRIISCLGNPIEQNHRGIEQRYYPTPVCKALVTAVGFYRVSEAVRNSFRPRRMSLGKRRELFVGRYFKLKNQFCVTVSRV
jgi:putative transposase